MALNQEQKNQIISNLNTKGANKSCECCGNSKFTVVDEVAQIRIAEKPNLLGGPTLPCAVVVCVNCGNLRFHALATIGLKNFGDRNA